VLDSQPSDYWQLGETTGTTAADTAGGKNGTYTGGVTLNQTGALTASGDSNPSAAFNGTTGWITTPVTLSTAQLSNFSLEAWVNFSTVPSVPETVVGIAGSIKLQITGGGLGHVQLVYVDATGTSHTYSHINPMWPTGWHHITVGYRPGGRVEIELDGVMTDFSGAPAPAGNSNTLSIGRTAGTSDWYAGQIDDVSLYTHDLSSLERQQHNTRGLNPPVTTSAYYRFGGLEETSDTASSPSLTDADVNAPDGTDLVHDTWDPTGGDSANNFLYYNGHGDLAVETDNTGTVEDTHTYDPFGAPLDPILSNNTDIAPTGTTERYTATWDKKTDDSTGLIQMGARMYDPTLGRFYAVDPISGGSLNNYDYAAQDPINGYDLSGAIRELQDSVNMRGYLAYGGSNEFTDAGGLASIGTMAKRAANLVSGTAEFAAAPLDAACILGVVPACAAGGIASGISLLSAFVVVVAHPTSRNGAQFSVQVVTFGTGRGYETIAEKEYGDLNGKRLGAAFDWALARLLEGHRK
jgi:RHS repeat-associated protein